MPCSRPSALAAPDPAPRPPAAQMPGGAPQAARRAPCTATTARPPTPTGSRPTPVSGDYAFEFSLGFLLTTPGPGRVPRYGCVAGAADHYLSLDAALRGLHRARDLRVGVLRAARRASVPLYRCLRAGRRSLRLQRRRLRGRTRRSCGSATCAPARPSSSRYVEPSASYHWVTSGLVVLDLRPRVRARLPARRRRAGPAGAVRVRRRRRPLPLARQGLRGPRRSSGSPAGCTPRRRRARTSSRCTAAWSRARTTSPPTRRTARARPRRSCSATCGAPRSWSTAPTSRPPAPIT